MSPAIQYLAIRKKKTLVLIGASFAAGYLWKWYRAKSQRFEIPGSRSTVPDDVGHYDMDGVSFDDDCGVVVGSDARTPALVKKTNREKLPPIAS